MFEVGECRQVTVMPYRDVYQCKMYGLAIFTISRHLGVDWSMTSISVPCHGIQPTLPELPYPVLIKTNILSKQEAKLSFKQFIHAVLRRKIHSWYACLLKLSSTYTNLLSFLEYATRKVCMFDFNEIFIASGWRMFPVNFVTQIFWCIVDTLSDNNADGTSCFSLKGN